VQRLKAMHFPALRGNEPPIFLAVITPALASAQEEQIGAAIPLLAVPSNLRSWRTNRTSTMFLSGFLPGSKKQKFPVSTSKAPYNIYAE
jgi:hypothetical protein